MSDPYYSTFTLSGKQFAVCSKCGAIVFSMDRVKHNTWHRNHDKPAIEPPRGYAVNDLSKLDLDSGPDF